VIRNLRLLCRQNCIRTVAESIQVMQHAFKELFILPHFVRLMHECCSHHRQLSRQLLYVDVTERTSGSKGWDILEIAVEFLFGSRLVEQDVWAYSQQPISTWSVFMMQSERAFDWVLDLSIKLLLPNLISTSCTDNALYLEIGVSTCSVSPAVGDLAAHLISHGTQLLSCPPSCFYRLACHRCCAVAAAAGTSIEAIEAAA